ncbi:PEPxxWA-CTERM sorting domain-containing protein [Sphingomonas sp.]|jgi:hypothetical protein|uniref:PEPxxWA-CTERM sorting domain-containing protein n=1 Tax=Sphingomonas sp. TaxID=28214 RepID=UPI002DE853F5|nr:PEPxxWA-CTERM sorting domain-containing protein [Sphingomonas sp.]
MRKTILALALLGSSVSAHAAVYTGEITGTVTSSFATAFTAPGATGDIKVGDTITARFTFAKSEASGGPAGWMAGSLLASMMTDEISFELAGHRWTSRGDFLDGMVPLAFGPIDDPLNGFSLTTDDAPGAGDLQVQGYAFEIGEFGYHLYQGLGYAGSFDRNTLKLWSKNQLIAGPDLSTDIAPAPVPEPASWALMIAGFGLAGSALRSTRRTSKVSLAAA